MKFKIVEFQDSWGTLYALYRKGWFFWHYEAVSYDIPKLRQKAITIASKETVVEEFEE